MPDLTVMAVKERRTMTNSTRVAHWLFAGTLLFAAAAVVASRTGVAEDVDDLPAASLFAAILVAGGLALMAALVPILERLASRTSRFGPVLVIDLVLPVTLIALEVPGFISGDAVVTGPVSSWTPLVLAAAVGALCAVMVAWLRRDRLNRSRPE